MMVKAIARIMDWMPASKNKSAEHLAHRLGWFSIALGVLEIVAPHRLSRTLGFRGGESLIASYGLREVATGVAILASRNPRRSSGAGWQGMRLTWRRSWARSEQPPETARRSGVRVCRHDHDRRPDLRSNLDGGPERKRSRIPDYSNRTGFPKMAAQLRGAAARDFRIPADMRAAPVNTGARQ